MKERESYGYDEDLPDTPLSPLDRDILDLFTTSETDLATIDQTGHKHQEVLCAYIHAGSLCSIILLFYRLLLMNSRPLQRN